MPAFHLTFIVDQQRPILLSGHERSLTQVKFNLEGDLLFSVAKDNVVNAWFSHNGERLGTYEGHNGTVWSVDVDCKFIGFLASERVAMRITDTFRPALFNTAMLVVVLVLSLSQSISSLWHTHPFEHAPTKHYNSNPALSDQTCICP